MLLEHTHKFKWSDGWGYTPCTETYYYLAEALRVITYNDAAHNQLTKELKQMEKDGHCGEPVRYAQQDKHFAWVCQQIQNPSAEFWQDDEDESTGNDSVDDSSLLH